MLGRIYSRARSISFSLIVVDGFVVLLLVVAAVVLRAFRTIRLFCVLQLFYYFIIGVVLLQIRCVATRVARTDNKAQHHHVRQGRTIIHVYRG
jgi:hypothetical protein